MKKLFTFLLIVFLFFTIKAQTTSPQVISSSGDSYITATASLSWTLGEVSTETYSGGSHTLTQGFQQPITVTITGVNLNLLTYLEGAYSGSQMTTKLNIGGQIPLSQPYNIAPWNYSGTESVSAIPNSNVVDWVLIELRDATSAANATISTQIVRKAAFLLKNGSVVDLNGSSILQFPSASYSHKLYAVIWHRNHLGILSANDLTESGGTYSYDFSTALTQVYNGGSGYKEIATGVCGMVAGDADANGFINTSDHNIWKTKTGQAGYNTTDYNLDTQTENKDKNDLWLDNIGKSSQVPN